MWSEYPIHSDMCQRGNERVAELEAQLAAAEAERDALKAAACFALRKIHGAAYHSSMKLMWREIDAARDELQVALREGGPGD